MASSFSNVKLVDVIPGHPLDKIIVRRLDDDSEVTLQRKSDWRGNPIGEIAKMKGSIVNVSVWCSAVYSGNTWFDKVELIEAPKAESDQVNPRRTYRVRVYKLKAQSQRGRYWHDIYGEKTISANDELVKTLNEKHPNAVAGEWYTVKTYEWKKPGYVFAYAETHKTQIQFTED